MDSLDRVLEPQSIAVVGSKSVDNHMWLRTIQPFEGKKYHVNVDRNEWASAKELGFDSFPSILDVPESIDLVIVSVPAQIVPRILKDCATKKVIGVHLYTAGFSETGTAEGIELEKEIERISIEGNLKIVGPNCMGIFNPKLGIGVNLGRYHGEYGNLAFISQSGSQSVAFAQGSAFHDLKVSKLVSMGNGIILDSHDYLKYLANDDDTKVIGMYLEGIRSGKDFFKQLKEISKIKPTMIWKVGETDDAERAVASHSTSKTSNPKIWDDMLIQCNAIKIDNMDEMFETAKLLAKLDPPKKSGYNLGVLALSGGHATEMANVFSKAGFSIPRLSEKSYNKILTKFNLVGSTYTNPIEGRTLANEDHLNNVLDVLNEDSNVDIIVHEIHISNRNDKLSVYRGHTPEIFCEFKKRAKKPYVVLISTTYPHPSPEDRSMVYKQLTDAGIPAVFGMENTANSLRKYVEYYQRK